VAIYLGIIAAGAAVVGMPESFSTEEIATRLRIAGASLVFTQDIVQPGTKGVPLCNRVTAADAPPAIIVATSGTLNAALRPEDRDYRLFLSDNDKLVTVDCDAGAPVNILFSSGTTGEPKAIPWDHTTAIKCAADAHFHQDVHAGDVLCWPTSLGWMMGPWILFGALMNHSALAIYDHSATLTGFGKFVQDAGVTMLGLVPSLVRSWRHSGKMEQYDWSAVKVFSSSGECSNGPDTLYLMYLANYRPVIEYCGGTEIGGAYITSVVVRPSVPAAFNTPNLSIDFKMFNERGQVVDAGEAFLRGPSIGFSTRLLNRDHDKLYYADTPRDRDGMPLRRHGDEIVTLPGAYYRVIGRSDDTMNLSGIKVGCAEIERVVGEVDGVGEAAAIAVPEPGGGPSRLVVFVAAEPGVQFTAREIKPKIQRKIKEKLSSLFHLDEVRVVDSLPRTASNKVMRRELRAMLGQN
jgi:acetyl-CoA synthetase